MRNIINMNINLSKAEINRIYHILMDYDKTLVLYVEDEFPEHVEEERKEIARIVELIKHWD